MNVYDRETVVGLASVVRFVTWVSDCSSNETRCSELLEAESIKCDMGQFSWL